MFFDSSVRSTRTIVLRSGADLVAQRRHPLGDVRPVGALAQEVRVRAEPVHADPVWPWRRVAVRRPRADVAQHAVKASAQRRVRKPSRSAPSMPRSTCSAMSSGSSRK